MKESSVVDVDTQGDLPVMRRRLKKKKNKNPRNRADNVAYIKFIADYPTCEIEQNGVYSAIPEYLFDRYIGSKILKTNCDGDV